MKKNLILLALVVAFICSSFGHKCIHDEILAKNPQARNLRRFNQRYAITRADLSRMTAEQQQTTYQPIRITFIYDVLISEGTLTSAQLSEVQNSFFPQLRTIAAGLLSVIPVTGNLKISTSDSCSMLSS